MSDRLTSAQIRGARGMLGWSMLDLAKAAGLSVSTVKRVENGRSEPVSGDAYAKILGALEIEGVRFLPDDGNGFGMRLRSS